MGVETEVIKKGDYIHFKLSGEFPGKNILKDFDQILQASDNYNCSTILLDCINFKYELTTYDRYEIGEYIADTYGKKHLKIAFLGNPDVVDSFTETVAQNRGANFRMFTKEQEAIDWLLNKK
jgi:hypothetical protein